MWVSTQIKAQEITFKIINVTQFKEFFDFQYNYQTQKVDERREAICGNMNEPEKTFKKIKI
ncbi:MAG: hypothetical protein EAZ32_00430 [Cytophagia bacterium]|nr:MAG: hypothetical protein EAY69_02685 [Cytophagales bacterium]TAG23702.1 MAG: hypothetical protein EAZ38_02860 [Cytophagales bacterium]TAG42939.1 MAG: hypothetical protein EAZ32_00430 [Cytophagia bacterium]